MKFSFEMDGHTDTIVHLLNCTFAAKKGCVHSHLHIFILMLLPTLFTIVPPHFPGDKVDMFSKDLILMWNKENERNVMSVFHYN